MITHSLPRGMCMASCHCPHSLFFEFLEDVAAREARHLRAPQAAVPSLWRVVEFMERGRIYGAWSSLWRVVEFRAGGRVRGAWLSSWAIEVNADLALRFQQWPTDEFLHLVGYGSDLS